MVGGPERNPMDKTDIHLLSVAELSRLIEKRELSPVEVTDASLERMERLDPKLNAYLTVCGDDARQAATEAEQALSRGEYHGPMHGIPVAVKDQMYTRGIRTTFGSPIFGDFVPDEDATVIARLKDAGAILLGKLNATEFCTTGFSHAFKTARNPWDLQRYTGGSSSGSGAATAAGLCATSLGEDTVGSIRFPAAWCGLVGLKPTWSRVSRYGLKPGLFSMDTLGPISRTVEDCAMTLQAIAGHDPRDSFSSKAPVPDYRAALKEDLRGVRVGLVKEDMSSEVVAPEVRDAALKAAEVLRQLGASVDEVSTPLADDAWTRP